ERPGVHQAERPSEPGLERPHAVADHAGTDHEVQLVHQAVGEQVVPEDVTAEDQDLPPRALLECGDFRVRVRASNDAGGAPPFDRVWLQAIRNDDLLDGKRPRPRGAPTAPERKARTPRAPTAPE